MTTGIERVVLWARCKQDLDKLREESGALRIQQERLERTMEECSKELRGTLGSNIPRRVYDLGNGMLVMVSIAAGVELIEVERPSLKDA